MSTANLLGSTARWTAGVRAKEGERADQLFNDPWAAALAGPEGRAWIEGRSADSVVPIVIRTRFFDDFLQDTTRRTGLRQIVLPGAGLDTRGYRLSWPDQTRLFELDQVAVLTYKEEILRDAGAQPNCERQAVGADLTAPWRAALIEYGFDPLQPSVWLMEGFLFYLSNEHVASMLEQVTELAASGSWLAFDIINSTMLASPLTQKWVEMQANSGAPWIGTMDDPVGILAKRGWRASLTQAGAEDANYGRWPFPVIPVTMPGMPHNWFVTAQKVAHDD